MSISIISKNQLYKVLDAINLNEYFKLEIKHMKNNRTVKTYNLPNDLPNTDHLDYISENENDGFFYFTLHKRLVSGKVIRHIYITIDTYNKVKSSIADDNIIERPSPGDLQINFKKPDENQQEYAKRYMEYAEKAYLDNNKNITQDENNAKYMIVSFYAYNKRLYKRDRERNINMYYYLPKSYLIDLKPSSDSEPEDAEGLLIKEMLECIRTEVAKGNNEEFTPSPYESFGYESYFL